jgi:uncharacterized protein
VISVLRPRLLAWMLVLQALALAFASTAWAQELLPVPALSGRVIDQTGTLGAEQKGALEQQLAAVESKRGTQVVVLMVASTQPEDIASYAQRVGDAWKIGRRNVGDGLLIVVAKSDRHMRIEVAKALEGAVPDLAARQVIDQAMRPAFRQNDYAGGLAATGTAMKRNMPRSSRFRPLSRSCAAPAPRASGAGRPSPPIRASSCVMAAARPPA